MSQVKSGRNSEFISELTRLGVHQMLKQINYIENGLLAERPRTLSFGTRV